MSKARKELESSLSELSLSTQNHKKASTPRKKPKYIVDSWEDDLSGEETSRPITASSSADCPNAPPPTPISPTTFQSGNSLFSDEIWAPSAAYDGTANTRERTIVNTRPEKTDAVAKRLIAGALGVRAPKMTDEQKAYDRAVKEKEIKRRNGEKEAKMRAEEEAARAKAAVWSD